jgi:DNA-binding CsgD family transcriptional regulator
MPNKIKNDFIEARQELHNNNVKFYAKYIINSQGVGYIITDNKDLYDMHINENLAEIFIHYLSEEALFVRINHLSFVMRSAEKRKEEYLALMEKIGLNNGLVKYHFLNNRIEISCFFADERDIESRDFFINRILLLEKIENKILVPFMSLKIKNLAQNNGLTLIRPNLMSNLISDSQKSIREYEINLGNGSLNRINYHEAVYLSLLLFECSNDYIARKLYISESKVKNDLRMLKEKLFIDSRRDLINFACDNEYIRKLARDIINDLL